MYRYVLIAAVSLLSVVGGSANAQNANVGIAAVVNDDLITTNDVDARYNMAVQGANLKPNPVESKQIRKQALDALIDEQIRQQEAGRLDAIPSDEEVDESFSRLASQNRLSAEQFKAMLKKTPGVYESLKRQLKTQIAWGNVVRKKIRPQINITEDDINAYLAEKEKNPAKVEYQVAEIFMKNNEGNLNLAKKLVSDLRSGKQRFAILARQFSQGLEASKGGLLGWIQEKRLEPVLDQAIAKTPAGQVTDAIVSQRGLHIFLVREKRDILATKEASQRVHVKQVAIPLPPNLPEEINVQAMAHMKFLQKESKNCKAMGEVIEKVNSPMSIDLGKVRLADLPAHIVKHVKNLPLEKVTDPIRTSEGYALYMVCEREEHSDSLIRDDVADTIGTDRLNRLQYRYYRDLRSASYVDIKER